MAFTLNASTTQSQTNSVFLGMEEELVRIIVDLADSRDTIELATGKPVVQLKNLKKLKKKKRRIIVDLADSRDTIELAKAGSSVKKIKEKEEAHHR